jgi:hypothetical protein
VTDIVNGNDELAPLPYNVIGWQSVKATPMTLGGPPANGTIRPDAGFTPRESACDFVIASEAVIRVQLPKCFARDCNDAQSATVLDPASGALKSPIDMRIEIRNALCGKFIGLFLSSLAMDIGSSLGFWCGVGERV